MAHQSTSEKLGQVIFNMLQESHNEEYLQEIGDILATFRNVYSRSRTDVRKHPFARNLLDCMEEAVALHLDQTQGAQEIAHYGRNV